MQHFKKKRLAIVGSFGYGKSGLDGQTIKTHSVYRLLEEKAIEYKITKVDTLDHRFTKVVTGIWNILCCSKLIMMPAHRSLATLFPICYILSKIFHFDIIIICIGGWQYEFFVGGDKWKPHKTSMQMSKKIKLFMPELQFVDINLRKDLGFRNTKVFPNFRFFESLTVSQPNNNEPLKCVFMARVNKRKGYPDLFKAFSILNQKNRNITLSIFGTIEDEERDDFFTALQNSENIEYGGEIESSRVPHTLSQFDVLLLPTHYYTEGFPGSILDAYIAGLPVIVSKWKHAYEFVEEGKTGLIYKFDDDGVLLAKSIIHLDNRRDLLNKMKIHAKEAAWQYSSEVAWLTIKDNL